VHSREGPGGGDLTFLTGNEPAGLSPRVCDATQRRLDQPVSLAYERASNSWRVIQPMGAAGFEPATSRV
jgi:hypothetical protein